MDAWLRQMTCPIGGVLNPFGFTSLDNFDIRSLFHAGKPNFRVLDSIVVT